MRPSERIGPHRDRMLELIAGCGASNPRVFGSCARGDDDEDSDVDLLVDYADDCSLLDEIGLRLDLQDLLGCPVDVVEACSLHDGVRQRVLRDARPL